MSSPSAPSPSSPPPSPAPPQSPAPSPSSARTRPTGPRPARSTAAGDSRRSSRRVPPPARPGPFDAHRRLTSRDRLLLAWLAEHYLLSSDQIARALFDSPRTARRRLTILDRLRFLTHIPRGADTGAPLPWLYTLGPLGLDLHPTAYSDPDQRGLRPPRSSTERAKRLVGSPNQRHFLGVNQFFVDLHAHTRHHPDARLARWWSERHATDAYASAGIHPDGHGIWTAHGTTVGFFLELDNDTENLARVIAKLRAYDASPSSGPATPSCSGYPATAGRPACCAPSTASTPPCPSPPPCTTLARPRRSGL